MSDQAFSEKYRVGVTGTEDENAGFREGVSIANRLGCWYAGAST